MVLFICEIYFRLPFFPQQLEYQPDSELGAEFRAKQKGYMWLGNMSFKSPTITINGDGHRGRETDWSKPVILAGGNSEAFGAGVEDSETWTAYMEEYLRKRFEMSELQVVNTAHPGQGPYQHYVRIRRALGKADNVRAIIVRVDVADRYFKHLSQRDLAREMRGAEIRQKVRRYTRSLPYLYNKVSSQSRSIKSALSIKVSRERNSVAQDTDVGSKMWEANRRWWKAIQDLCSHKGIPLVFMVYDREDTASAKVLLENLRSFSLAGSSARVFHLGPRCFGQTTEVRGERAGKVGDDLTLGRDPHASGLQHRCIARAVTGFPNSTALERHSSRVDLD